MNFLEFRSWFDEIFQREIEQKINEFSSLSNSSEISTVINYVKDISLNGKRFRPYVVFLASGMDLKEIKNHYKLLIAIEMLHLFALVHDDVMDNAYTRHGVLCIQNKFASEFGKKQSESLAILAGDTLFAWSYDFLFEYLKEFPHEKDLIQSIFNRLVLEVIHGQMIDVIMPSIKNPSIELISEKMNLKTARYSFVQPLKIGFTLSTKDFDFAEDFGHNLGILFQVQDDLLDVGYGKNTGKKLFKDFSEKQPTLLSWFIENKCTTDQISQFNLFWGKDIESEEYQKVKDFIEETGALSFVINQVDLYKNNTQHIVNTYNIKDKGKWLDFIELVSNRAS